jgi:hypothetical protein
MKVVTYWISSETSPHAYCSSNQLRCQERICISLLKTARSITASADTGHATDRYIGYVREYVLMYVCIYVMCVLFIKPRQILKHRILNQLHESPRTMHDCQPQRDKIHHGLKCSITPLIQTFVIRNANYPDRLGSSGKSAKNTKLTCL